MTEFFITANSFAAPFFSDTTEKFVEAETAEEALRTFAESYTHPAGLFAAVAYKDANDMKKGRKPLAKWRCNHEIEKMRLTENLGSYIFLGHGPGKFEIDNQMHEVRNPKAGHIVPV